MAASNVSLKLLIDTKSQKVLFAEAGKDFVDFLFTILALPIGTVVRILTKKSMVGCLGNLYESIENLNQTYMQPNQNKDGVLKPKAAIDDVGVPLLLPKIRSSTARKLYMCGSKQFCGHPYVADDSHAICPCCRSFMSRQVTYVAPPDANEVSMTSEGGGYVKGVVTYMVMDDLAVTPMSTISSITLLNRFNVKEVAALEEKVVDFSMDEGVKLLEACLQSKTPFLPMFSWGRKQVVSASDSKCQFGRSVRFLGLFGLEVGMNG